MAAYNEVRPTLEPPYTTRERLERRFLNKVSPAEGGCLLWTGTRLRRKGIGPSEGRMRLTCAPNKTKSVFASRISWWLQTDRWPPPGAELRHTCGKSHCVAFAHLRLVTLEERCKLTEEVKLEMRARYARRMSVLRRVFGRQAEDKRLKGAVTRTAEETWVGRETVLRILRGKRTTPTHWISREYTAEDVRAVYARYAKQEAEHRVQLAAVAKHTMAQMAKEYGVCAKTVSRVVFEY